MPSTDLVVKISADLLTQIRKAAGVLGHSIISIQGDDGTIVLNVVDPKNSAANTFSVILDENNPQTRSFDLQFLIANLKVLSGDYEVNVSSKLVSHWKHESLPVQYYIALEKTSTFN